MPRNALNTLVPILVLALVLLLVAVPIVSAVCMDTDSDGYGVCPDCNISNNCTYDGHDCDDNYNLTYPEATELCDGKDNDCNGTRDDGFWIQGFRPGAWGCYGQYGVCANYQGEVECLDEQTSICSTDPGGMDDKSSTETCNGLDDDCDGTDDNGGDALCSAYSIAEVAICSYDPDANPFTWDWFPAFGSVCQGASGCTIYDGSNPWTLDITHTCNLTCGGCESDGDCTGDQVCIGCACVLQGDVNDDCIVNIFDLAMVGMAYGTQPGSPYWDARADLNNDGKIGIIDLATVGMHFRGRC